jgi:protein-L-isoaspartate(D-aspartate) O-methyltransferase
MSLHDLVTHLQSTAILTLDNLIKALEQIDRADFVLPEYQALAYEDVALPIGAGQTISQPSTVVFMLKHLSPKPGERILEVGSGSGWVTALVAELVGKKGNVVGVELIPELTRLGQRNLATYELPQARIVQAIDQVGLPEEAPFDKILVSAAAQELPQDLVEQLRVGGTMVIPIQNSIYKVTKLNDTEIDMQEFPGFMFVPLRTQS